MYSFTQVVQVLACNLFLFRYGGIPLMQALPFYLRSFQFAAQLLKHRLISHCVSLNECCELYKPHEPFCNERHTMPTNMQTTWKRLLNLTPWHLLITSTKVCSFPNKYSCTRIRSFRYELNFSSPLAKYGQMLRSEAKIANQIKPSPPAIKRTPTDCWLSC